MSREESNVNPGTTWNYVYSILYRCKKSQNDQDELNGEINSAWASNQMVFDKSLGMCVAHW